MFVGQTGPRSSLSFYVLDLYLGIVAHIRFAVRNRGGGHLEIADDRAWAVPTTQSINGRLGFS